MLLQSSSRQFVIQTGDLEVRYTLAEDRWRHVLAVRDGPGARILLESEEGAAGADDAPSPPFQDLHLEDLGGGVHEFQLLGQAGHAIYSAAIRCEGPAERVSFDVFARARRSSGVSSTRPDHSELLQCSDEEHRPELGCPVFQRPGEGLFAACSTYRVPADVDIVAAEADRIWLRSGRTDWELSTWTTPRTAAARLIAESKNPRRIAVWAIAQPTPNSGKAAPLGIGWQYGVRRLGGP